MAVATRPLDSPPQGARVPSRNRQVAWLCALFGPLVLGPAWAALAGVIWPGHLLATWTGFVVLALIVSATYTDLMWAKIYNWATYSALLWGLLLNMLASLGAGGQDPDSGALGAGGLFPCFLGTVICFFVLLFIYRLAGGGAGDVKLAAALGALLGPQRGLDALIFTYALAGVVLLSWAIWTVGPVLVLGSFFRLAGSLLLPHWVGRPTDEQKRLLQSPVPLAAFFAGGTLVVLTGVNLPW